MANGLSMSNVWPCLLESDLNIHTLLIWCQLPCLVSGIVYLPRSLAGKETISQWQVISWTSVLSCMFCNSQACACRFFSAYVWFPLSLICFLLCKISFFSLFVYLKSNQFCCWWVFNFELHLSHWSTLLDFDFINLMNWVLLSGRCELACRENDQGQWTSRCSSTELNLQTNEMSFLCYRSVHLHSTVNERALFLLKLSPNSTLFSADANCSQLLDQIYHLPIMPKGKIDCGKRISLPEQSMCLNKFLVRPDLGSHDTNKSKSFRQKMKWDCSMCFCNLVLVGSFEHPQHSLVPSFHQCFGQTCDKMRSSDENSMQGERKMGDCTTFLTERSF